MTSAKVKLFKHSCVDWDLVPGDWFLPAHWRRSIQSPCCLCIITIHFPLHWITNKKQGGTNSQLESTKMFFIIASADPARYLNCRHVWALGTLERTKRTELQRLLEQDRGVWSWPENKPDHWEPDHFQQQLWNFRIAYLQSFVKQHHLTVLNLDLRLIFLRSIIYKCYLPAGRSV